MVINISSYRICDNKKGVSLAELLVGIVIGAIVLLMISGVGSMVYQSYNSLRTNTDVYNDSQFALKLIREAVRQSTAVIPQPSSTCLTVPVASSTNDYFYNLNGSLIYGNIQCGDTSRANKKIITGVKNLTFTPSISNSSNNAQLVTVLLHGTKNGAFFSYSMSATRRNP